MFSSKEKKTVSGSVRRVLTCWVSENPDYVTVPCIFLYCSTEMNHYIKYLSLFDFFLSWNLLTTSNVPRESHHSLLSFPASYTSHSQPEKYQYDITPDCPMSCASFKWYLRLLHSMCKTSMGRPDCTIRVQEQEGQHVSTWGTPKSSRYFLKIRKHSVRRQRMKHLIFH